MYLGMDFGTSFSQSATMYLGKPVLLLKDGEYGIPSEFYYDREVGILIGQEALNEGVGIASVNLKHEVKMDLKTPFRADGRTFTPKEIVTEIYRDMLNQARKVASRKALDSKIEGVVLSVPAKFTYQERELIYTAARDCTGRGEAPLPIMAVVKEPVAAALAYYQRTMEDGKCILVYDLGGGTCDVALVHSNSALKEHYEVIDSDMERVGGKDWDNILIEYITRQLERESGIRINGNPAYEDKVRRVAIAAKYDLTEQSIVRVRVELGGRLYRVRVTRNTFDEITGELLDKTLDRLKLVKERNHRRYPVSEIICVGGSSNMPQVEEGIRQSFPDCEVRVFEPALAIANGTAIFADMIKDGYNPDNLRDIANFSYGIRVYYDYKKNPTYWVISNLIHKGEKLPAERAHFVTPVSDTHKNIEFQIYETEINRRYYDYDVPDKRHIGKVVMTLGAYATKDTKIRCTMMLGSDGRLHFNAVDDHGRTVESTFRVNVF